VFEATTNTAEENWDSLTLANNFIFCKVMESNPDLCKHLLELLLHIEIDHIEPPQVERTFQESISSKGVRFDVYTKSENEIFDIEIQTVRKKNLPKRARYYQSIIDVSNLNSGVNYKNLKDTYIIFICLQDVFGKGLPVYSFENICTEDKETKLDDRAFKIFFNAENCDKIESVEERAFFNFLKGKAADDNFTKHLEEKVFLAKKNLEWRNQYMTFKEQFCEEIEEAREEAYKEAYDEAYNLAYNEAYNVAYNKAYNKACTEVAAKTEESTKIENAKNLLKMNLGTIEQISHAVSLPLEQVMEIAENLKA